MLTHLKIRNFKLFEEIEFDLDRTVVLIGPNNSGKTSALQAIALWNVGAKKWSLKRTGAGLPESRPGVTINRRDLTSIPVPQANLLWRDLHSRNVFTKNGKTERTENIRIDIILSGIEHDRAWTCGLEFDFANDESIYCRPLRTGEKKSAGEKKPTIERMPFPKEVESVNVAFLPPMSGLADREYLKQPGEIYSLIGQGKTAEVLRNQCYKLFVENPEKWNRLNENLQSLFAIKLMEPIYNLGNAEIILQYEEHGKLKLDLSVSGRGFQQTTLLLSFLYANPNTVLLLDEPDAHLEVLRQQQNYGLVSEIAESQKSQLVIASHSEVVLGEAAERDDPIIAFLGKPHRLNNRGSQLLKSLKQISFDDYYRALQTGWVLYLEGESDLSILRAFAEILRHPAVQYLERPFVKYILNQPARAREHFYGLREAKSDLVGVAIFDRLEPGQLQTEILQEFMWRKRELENYFCSKDVLLAYAQSGLPFDLFFQSTSESRVRLMQKEIESLEAALRTLNKPSPWSDDIKISDDFLNPLFENYSNQLGIHNEMRKKNYYKLVPFVPEDQINPEISEKLDAIVKVAQSAKPLT